MDEVFRTLRSRVFFDIEPLTASQGRPRKPDSTRSGEPEANIAMDTPPIAPAQEWEAARRQLIQRRYCEALSE
ncbi:MAG TPA: hypothetical protein VJT49_28320 [Amycolatopsis sp.]|uniref:hypothetical protein n=1 Tax=Amycolatopsis sp. TaxID=37632 RepID=UPI002B4905E8|nr:hypothetical protein [Amycolatopsis sp.]HKS48944.1 hypothetical protein [Amycolatopsis sp.]